MHNDVGIPSNGGGEVGVEGHIEGVVAPLTAVFQSTSAKVLCSLGREEGGGEGRRGGKGRGRGGEERRLHISSRAGTTSTHLHHLGTVDSEYELGEVKLLEVATLVLL